MIKTKARDLIINHLKEHGDEIIEDIDITPRMVLFWWKLLNIAVFDSKLCKPWKISCRNFHDMSYGWVRCKRQGYLEMGIRRRLEDKRLFLNILAHEMVHQYQWEIDNVHITHGKTFWKWSQPLREYTTLTLYVKY